MLELEGLLPKRWVALVHDPVTPTQQGIGRSAAGYQTLTAKQLRQGAVRSLLSTRACVAPSEWPLRQKTTLGRLHCSRVHIGEQEVFGRWTPLHR